MELKKEIEKKIAKLNIPTEEELQKKGSTRNYLEQLLQDIENPSKEGHIRLMVYQYYNMPLSEEEKKQIEEELKNYYQKQNELTKQNCKKIYHSSYLFFGLILGCSLVELYCQGNIPVTFDISTNIGMLLESIKGNTFVQNSLLLGIGISTIFCFRSLNSAEKEESTLKDIEEVLKPMEKILSLKQ